MGGKADSVFTSLHLFYFYYLTPFFYGFDFMPVSVSIMSKPIIIHSEDFGISTVPSPDETLDTLLALFVIVRFDFILK